MPGGQQRPTAQELDRAEAHLREGFQPGLSEDPEVLLAALEQLTPDERAVLRVRFLDGRTIADAAEMLGLPLSEVIRLQAQALVALCRALDAR